MPSLKILNFGLFADFFCLAKPPERKEIYTGLVPAANSQKYFIFACVIYRMSFACRAEPAAIYQIIAARLQIPENSGQAVLHAFAASY